MMTTETTAADTAMKAGLNVAAVAETNSEWVVLLDVKVEWDEEVGWEETTAVEVDVTQIATNRNTTFT